MSNRKYSRLAEGYHDRSQYHPYQTGSKYSAKNHTNCLSDSRDRSPSSGSGSRGSSPYSSRHSNNSPRLIRSKSTHSRSRDIGKKGSSKSPSDSRHSNNSHSTDHHGKFNHVNNDFPWSQHTSSSGKLYYYNCKTEKSQWEKPKEWIERENREKERKERERKELLVSKHSNGSREYGYTTRDTDLSRNANLSKLSRSGTSKGQKEYSSPKDGRERRPDTHQLDSRTHCYSDNRKKDYNSPSSMYISDGRGHSVVKTSSANTVALSTNTHRSAPVAALPGGEDTVSPVGSVQDVSPPSTPSSHPGSLEHMSHSSSPQLPTLSPLVAQFHSSQSPHLQLPQSQVQPYSTRQPNLPVQNVLSQSAVSNCQLTVPAQYTYTSQQSFIPQMRPVTSSLGQYSHVNKAVPSLQQHKQQPVSYGSSSVQAATASPQTCQATFDSQVRQPALHPLQQATLLQQRQMLSEVELHQQSAGLSYNTSYSSAQTLASHHHSVAPAVTHPTAVPLPVSAVHHSKEPELNTHNASSSPYSSVGKDHVSSQAPLPPLAPITISQPHPGPSLPAPSQPSPPVVNLQSLAKYTDKSVTNLASGWPSEIIEKQVQRCWDDSTCFLSECAKTSSEHLEMQSQLSFMELRLDVGTKRISQLKEMTKTLEVLLEGSDAKSLM